MPLYEYQCDACGHRFEVIRKFSDEPLEGCPKCGGHIQKLISAPAFAFKGSGWYVTDYAKKDPGAGGKSDDGKEGSSEKDSKGREAKDKDAKDKDVKDKDSTTKTESSTKSEASPAPAASPASSDSGSSSTSSTKDS